MYPEKCYNMCMKLYKGYSTNDVNLAVDLYKKKTGFDPTVILIRPDFVFTGSHPGLVKSKHAAANMILVSHLLTTSEIDRVIELSNPEIECDDDNDAQDIDDEITFDKKKNVIKLNHSSKKDDQDRYYNRPTCPHCKQKIMSFEDLGWWWGWKAGIEPPYWDQLREYVFARDKYTCQMCGKSKKENAVLICHHVDQKEDGGSDSARNLITLCQDCHPDDKPLYEETE